jgi:hypothetical protein
MKKLLLVTLSILLALLIMSCSVDPPVIQSFSATPTSMQVRNDVTLSWNVTGADTVSIDQGVGDVSASGTKTVTMDTKGTITFTLSATNSGGTVVSTARVEVNAYTWYKTFGGSDDDLGWSVQQTTDGGYIVTGLNGSNGTSGGGTYLIKTDSSGNLAWEKTFSGWMGWSVQQTTDSGYIIAGSTEAIVADRYDVCLIKTDTSGNVVWENTFGCSDGDPGFGWSVQQTTDGGYIMVGSTDSFGAGEFDIYLVKRD